MKKCWDRFGAGSKPSFRLYPLRWVFVSWICCVGLLVPLSSEGAVKYQTSVYLGEAPRCVASLVGTPNWAIPYGQEFWCRPAAQPNSPMSAEPPSFNVGDVIERTSYAVQPRAIDGQTGVNGKTYQAAFDPQGMTITPRTPDRELAKESAGIRTEVVRMGDLVLYDLNDKASENVALGNTVQRLLNEKVGLIEHWQTRSDGVEVSWILKQPAGPGPLTIEISLNGLNYSTTTQTGQHFADANGQARLRVGEAKAVDADGRAWPLTTTVAANQLMIQVPAEILSAASYPLAIDPVITPEFGVDAPVYGCQAAGDELYPAITWGSTNYLIVWMDGRNNHGDYEFIHNVYDLYGVRVNSSGIPQDLASIPICVSTNACGFPSVAWGETHFLVVWAQNDGKIYGTRVSSGGRAADAEGFVISSTTNYQTFPHVAWGQTNFLVVWGVDVPSEKVYGARVTSSGNVLDPNGFVICNTNSTSPSVAWGATNFMVVWNDQRDGAFSVYGGRVTSSGTLLDGSGFRISSTSTNPLYMISDIQPSLAWNGTVFLAAWDEYHSDVTSLDIYGARITGNAQVLDPSGIPICTRTNIQMDASVCWAGTNFMVVWSHGDSESYNEGDIYGARVSGAGQVIDAAGRAICLATNVQREPEVAGDGTNYLAVWEDVRYAGYSDIYGTRLNQAGAVLDGSGRLMSLAANKELTPVVVRGNDRYLIVWEDGRNSQESDIYGITVDDNGRALNASPFPICTAIRYQQHPAAAWNGTNYLVVWDDMRNEFYYSTIYGARVNSTGGVLDVSGIAVHTNRTQQRYPTVAWGGTNYLVAWEDWRFNFDTFQLFATRVSSNGQVLDKAGIPLNSPMDHGLDPSIAWAGTNFMVVWSEGFGPELIRGSRVSSAGKVLNYRGVVIAPDRGYSQLDPFIVWGQTNFFVAWQEGSLDRCDVYGTMLDRHGVPLNTNGFLIASVTNHQSHCSAGWSKTNFFVVWQDDRNSSSYDAHDVYGAHVTSGGHVLDPSGIPLVTNLPNLQYPVVACDRSSDGAIIVYETFQGPPVNAPRTAGIVVWSSLTNLTEGLSISTTNLLFTVTSGSSSSVQVWTLSNLGQAAISYSNAIAYGAGGSGWFSVKPASGTLQPGASRVCTGSVSVAGLDSGWHVATNRIATVWGNNQMLVRLFYLGSDDFSFRAVALTNNVILRWADPMECGFSNKTVLILSSTSHYPSNTTDGTEIYRGTDQVFEHTGLVSSQIYYYTIWLSQEGTNFVDPP
jgi:hypothetical protein